MTATQWNASGEVNDLAGRNQGRRRTASRRALSLVVLTAVTVVLAGLVSFWLPQGGSRAADVNKAALVVRLGDGSVETRCVEFVESEITGHDVLIRSGVDVVENGGFICAIEGVGCPADECVTCQAPSYWSYWHLLDGAWVYSPVGSTGYMVHDGDVEGWGWGLGVPPPATTFYRICGWTVFLPLFVEN
jgi:hypothetical protein